MLGSVAVAEVQQILGWRSDKAAEILAALQYAQREREKPGMTLPWWLLSTHPFSMTISAVYTIPNTFIQEADETTDGDMFYISSTGRVRYLRKMDWKTAHEAYCGANTTSEDLADTTVLTTGAPEVFSFVSSNILTVFPIPDQTYTIQWTYWAQDALVALNEENKWLLNAPWVLIGEAGKKLGADLGNSNAVATASAVLAKAEQNLFRSTIFRAEANVRRSLGSRL